MTTFRKLPIHRPSRNVVRTQNQVGRSIIERVKTPLPSPLHRLSDSETIRDSLCDPQEQGEGTSRLVALPLLRTLPRVGREGQACAIVSPPPVLGGRGRG